MEGTDSTDDNITVPNNTTLSGAGPGTFIQFANINGQTKYMITSMMILNQHGRCGVRLIPRWQQKR